MSCPFLSGFKKLCPFLAIDFRVLCGRVPHGVALALPLLAMVVLCPSARADKSHSVAKPGSATHLALGPQVAAIHYDSRWDSEVGAELHLAHIRDSDLLAVVGASLGVASFGQEDTLQLSLDVYAGTRSLTKLPIGLSLGPVLKTAPHGRAQLGARSTLWLYHGVMPYLSVAWLSAPTVLAQPSVEIGVKIPFSIWNW